MRARNSASSGFTSRPGWSTRNMPASRESWLRSARRALPAPGYWILTATRRPAFARVFHTARWTWPMLAAAAGHVFEMHELVAPIGAQLGREHLVHAGRRQRRRGLLELRERLPVGAGEVFGQRGLEDGQRLAELHRSALELAEDAEQMLGGALLELGGDLRRRRCHRRAFQGRAPLARRNPGGVTRGEPFSIRRGAGCRSLGHSTSCRWRPPHPALVSAPGAVTTRVRWPASTPDHGRRGDLDAGAERGRGRTAVDV